MDVINPQYIDRLNALKELVNAREADDVYRGILMLGLSILEGREEENMLNDIKVQASEATLKKMCTAAASLLWECSKYSGKNPLITQNLLLQSGLDERIAAIFAQVLTENRKRLLVLTKALSPAVNSYSNLSWRLEVTLAKRGMLTMTEPKYALRLDLANPKVGDNLDSSSEAKQQHHHLQCSYATMKLLEKELQKATDELASAHSRRLTKYTA